MRRKSFYMNCILTYTEFICLCVICTPSMLSAAHLYLSFSVCWSLIVMAGCLEHRHLSKTTKSPLTVERIEGRRRRLDFSHIRKMILCGHVKRKKRVSPKEVSLTSIVAKRKAVGGRWLLVAGHRELRTIPCRPEQELSPLQTGMCLQDHQ